MRLLSFLLLTSALFNAPLVLANQVDVIHKLIVKNCSSSIPIEIVRSVITHESKTFHKGIAQPWPWTLNVNGKGRYYRSKSGAIYAAKLAYTEGARKLGIGLGQIEWKYHGQRFDWDIGNAMEPNRNIAVVCDILAEGYRLKKVETWKQAVVYYHRPVMDKIGYEYASKVLSN